MLYINGITYETNIVSMATMILDTLVQKSCVLACGLDLFVVRIYILMIYLKLGHMVASIQFYNHGPTNSNIMDLNIVHSKNEQGDTLNINAGVGANLYNRTMLSPVLHCHDIQTISSQESSLIFSKNTM